MMPILMSILSVAIGLLCLLMALILCGGPNGGKSLVWAAIGGALVAVPAAHVLRALVAPLFGG